jgi:hypothetical protein
MRFLFPVIILLLACNNDSNKKDVEEVPLSTSRNSAEFNQAVDAMLLTYDSLTSGFVNWDSARIPAIASVLETRLQNLRTTDTRADSTYTSPAMEQLDLIQSAPSLEDKRIALNRFSNHLFQYLNSVQYDRKQLYLQKCPMAFNDTGEGIWISGADTIRNPYLGKFHPRYGRGMLSCGENKDVINYTGKETKGEN